MEGARMKMMPTARPDMGMDEVRAVEEVINSGWLGQGPKVDEFEGRLRDFLGASYAIAVASGTAALYLALRASGIGKGAEVLVPSMTFCASIQAIVAAGAVPVFCEIDKHTLCLDMDDAELRIGPNTRAIMVVDYGGYAPDLELISAVAGEHGLQVIEDAAHAFGTTRSGTRVGGDTVDYWHTCFSFDPIKNISCGEGGLVATANDDVASRVKIQRSLGSSADSFTRRTSGTSSYDVVEEGFRLHMSDINAAIGLVQLDRFEYFAARRKALVAQYNLHLDGAQHIQVPSVDLDSVIPFNYVIRVKNGQRDHIATLLQEQGIGNGVHYPPNHLQPYFKKYANTELPVTEQVHQEMLTLPLHTRMGRDDINRICSVLLDELG